MKVLLAQNVSGKVGCKSTSIITRNNESLTYNMLDVYISKRYVPYFLLISNDVES